MNRKSISAIALSSVIALSGAANAGTVTFESGQGYASGEIVGQPTGQLAGTPQWTGNAGAGAVAASGGSQVLEFLKGNAGSVNYAPSATFLGGAFTGANQYSFSVDISLPGTYADTNFNTEGQFYIGSETPNSFYTNAGSVAGTTATTAIKLQFTGTGIVSYYNGTTNVAINNSAALPRLLNTSNVLTLSGIINYATSTYSLSALETGQSTPTLLGSSIAFANVGTPAAAAFGYIYGNTQYDTGTAGVYRNYAFDNIAVSSVPEPASLGAIGLAAVGLIRRRRA